MKRFGSLLPLTLCGALALAVVSRGGAADSPSELPPGYTTARTGNIHDFDYLLGAWTTQQRRLKARDIGSSEWLEAPGNQHCAVSYLDGGAIVGGFVGTRGEFYGEDQDEGRPIKVRVIWTAADRDHVRWEQAFSYDNRTWETNEKQDVSSRQRIARRSGA
jgi:hypothetical protein